MRRLAWIGVLVLLLAGCVEDRSDATPPAQAWSMEAAPPERMVWSGSFTAGMGAGAVTGNPCEVASCDLRQFTLDGPFDVEATLTWGLPGNDFDLYLYQDGTEVGRADLDPPEDPQETREVLVHADLPPGDYEFLVVGSTMVADSYTLRADFS
jgi:hypothetical protein